MESSEQTVLLIEDEPTTVRYLTRLLKRKFSNIIHAANGEEALAALENAAVDLIITDLNMPKMSGFDFLKTLNTSQRCIPIVVISAYNYEELESGYRFDVLDSCKYEERVIEKEFIRGYIKKPFDTKELLDEIGRIMS